MTSGSDPKNPKKEQIEGNNQERTSSEDRSSSSPILRSVIDVPQTVIDEFNRQDREQARREEKQIFWNRLGVLAVIFYGAVAFFTWLALLGSNSINRRAANATKVSADAQIATVRAWLWPVKWQQNHIMSFEDMQAGKWEPFDFQLLNVGHTPALNPRMGRFRFIFHPGSFEPAPIMPEFPHCPNKAPRDIASDRESQVILPDDGPHLHLAVTTLSADQYKALSESRATLVIWGCVYYSIVSSEQLGISEYCTEWRPSGLWITCHGNNSMR